MRHPLTTIRAAEIVIITLWMAGGLGWRFADDTHFALLSLAPPLNPAHHRPNPRDPH